MIESSSRIYHLNEKVLIATFSDGGVAFDLENRKCLQLNTSGIFILNMLDGVKTIEKVVQEMVLIYGQPYENLCKDLEIYLEDLREKGWIDVR